MSNCSPLNNIYYSHQRGNVALTQRELTDMKDIKTFTFCILLSFFFSTIAFGQELRMRIEPPSGSTNDIFMLTLTTSGNASQYPQLAGGNDFDISFMGTQKSIQIINGKTTQKTIFQYQLRPKKMGKLLSPSASLGAEVAQAQVIDVKKGKQSTSQTSDGVAFEQKVTPEEVYVGQQVVHTIELMSRLTTVNLQIDDQSIEGFLQHQFPQTTSSRKSVKGKVYDVRSVRTALFPIKEGTYTIPKRKAVFEVRVRNPNAAIDPFNFDPFSMSPFQSLSRTKAISAFAEPTSIKVKQLPDGPADIVGLTSLKASEESVNLQVGKSFTIQYTLVSDGKLDGIKMLKEKPDAGLQIFWSKPKTEDFENQGRLFTRKTWTASVVGIKSGIKLLELQPLRVFDPYRERYRDLEPAAVVVSIGGDLPQREQETPDKDTQAPDSTLLDPPLKGTFSTSVVIYVALLFIVAGGFSFYFWLFKSRRDKKQNLEDAVKSTMDCDKLGELWKQACVELGNFSEETPLKEQIKQRVSSEPTDLNFQIQKTQDLLEEVTFSPQKRRLPELQEELQITIQQL